MSLMILTYFSDDCGIANQFLMRMERIKWQKRTNEPKTRRIIMTMINDWMKWICLRNATRDCTLIEMNWAMQWAGCVCEDMK